MSSAKSEASVIRPKFSVTPKMTRRSLKASRLLVLTDLCATNVCYTLKTDYAYGNLRRRRCEGERVGCWLGSVSVPEGRTQQDARNVPVGEVYGSKMRSQDWLFSRAREAGISTFPGTYFLPSSALKALGFFISYCPITTPVIENLLKRWPLPGPSAPWVFLHSGLGHIGHGWILSWWAGRASPALPAFLSPLSPFL